MPHLGYFVNERARDYNHINDVDTSDVQKFHSNLPGFTDTRLIPLDEFAKSIGVAHVFVKDESSRAGLPAFKILGASWGSFKAITARLGLPLDTAFSEVAKAARQNNIRLETATDGNHGRAIARTAALMGIPAVIHVPKFTDEATRNKIAGEGAKVIIEDGDYDLTVAEAYRMANASSETENVESLFIQDTSFANYEDIPRWIVQGYSTMFKELDDQLSKRNLKATHIVTPIGVGSLGNAVVAYCKSDNRDISVISVEPESAACLNYALRNDRPDPIEAGSTIMDGMCCGTVSPISWPALRDGIDVSTTISEIECHNAIQLSNAYGFEPGPCGAATLAAIKKLAGSNLAMAGLGKDSIVILLSTEGRREYSVPS